ncbi:UDP-glucose:glycoprotein glucosyltransferase 1-like [Ylistrum balloti]|uniref:UDP-glucose:glycoprotein glucosyltransferase 1-like n=1 Tax=Ylistrum balloti TaxID=509963 RepID=UPI0029059572|nr:UDP-glucose:glycoprotein glucosyltransferase 1-like [Ylistrum balloti]
MLLFTGLVVFCLLSVVDGKSKPITVTLNAKWNSTPLLLEASEFIAKESPESFWRYVGEIAKLDPKANALESDQGNYHMILKFAGKVISPLQLKLLQLSLSLRIYSPAVETFQQLAEGGSDDCVAFVNIHGQTTCDPEEVKSLVEKAADLPKPSIFKFDHIFPGSADNNVVVVLYAEVGKEGFPEFHKTLRDLADKKEITYVLRHFVRNPAKEKTRLSGYGVELAIKSTEYKAKDDTKVESGSSADAEEDEVDEVQGFIFSKLRELHPDSKDDLKAFQNHLVASSTELAALKVWQLQDLSLQAAQNLMTTHSSEVLSVLTDISQNFPQRARTLVKTVLTEEFKKELKKNQQYFETNHGLSAGESALFLNGLPVDIEVYDIYSLLELMRSETNLMEGLYSLSFKGPEVNQILRLDLSGDSEDFALDIRHVAVSYLNDLENDRKYKNWPSSVQDILRPTFPGMLRHVAKNFFHMVFVVDPLEKNSRELLKMAEAFLVHSAPVRIGVVLVVDSDREVTGYDDPGVAISRAFDYLIREESADRAIAFITDVYEKAQSKDLTADLVIKEFQRSYSDADEGTVFGEDDDYNILRKASNDFVSKSGLKDFPQVLMNGVPMDKKHLTEETFEEGVVSTILAQTPAIQKAVYQGTLHDFVNMQEWLMERDNVLPRLNSRVLTPAKKSLDFTVRLDADVYNDVHKFEVLNTKAMTSVMTQNMKYLTRKEENMLRPVTMWVVCDLETPEGRDLLYSALKQLKHTHDLRLGVIFNSPRWKEDQYYTISKAVYTALTTLEPGLAKSFITKLMKEENVKDLLAGNKQLSDLEVNGMDTMSYMLAVEVQNTDFLKVHRAFVEKVLGWEQSARGVLANGQVLGPLDKGERFLQEDVDLFQKYIFQNSAKKIKGLLYTLGHKDDKGSDLVMKVSSLLSQSGSTKERKEVQYAGDQHSVIKLPGNPGAPAYQLDVIIDPASREAQKMSAILMILKEVANVDLRIYMNCKDKLSELPVITFYRYVLEPSITFKVDGSYSEGPMAKFTDMPTKSLLTLGMNPSESWLVEAVTAPYDLDNILLEETKSGIHADFDLEYILLEGHCSDSTTGQPPRGLQFTLGRNQTEAAVDTIVMANLGYFQLKANPGTWFLKLREGRSLELYDIASHEFTDTPAGSDDVVVVMNSFKSKIIRIKVAKKPEKSEEQLLVDDQERGIWESISSTLTGDKAEEDDDKTLNIFSLASGHMYERLMRIMMMSVLKNTKSKVKFWFLKNYLSPSFKDFIPKMAQEYNFEFELVQYKWPRWLNQQKEKQRIMWGYKILFLDVLFPLDVKKIIFVDADQIVRTDLQELNDLDLGGAPYGYTPFCSSRTEMDGFRFWKSGYWASHLAGRKYHISALYVVDLKKFRRIAAGDRLRGQYQGLSQDPNSLSNLDQDLPNNMIHQVAIKSLPQEWLWCETWCSNESKAKAKTIDLCNNPQTKEPKLKAALRIVPEWKNYDYEIKILWDKVYNTNTRSQIEYDPPDIETASIGSKIKDEL